MRNRYFSFKRLFWPYTFCVIPFALLFGFLALFHVIPFYFNELPFYGLKGLMVAVLTIPFCGIIFSVVNWVLLNFGEFLYRSFLNLFKKGKA